MPYFDNQSQQYQYFLDEFEYPIGAVITTPPVYVTPLTNGSFPFGTGNLVVSSSTQDGVLHDDEVFSSLTLHAPEKAFNINCGGVQEVPSSGALYFWKAIPYSKMVVPVRQQRELKLKYKDNPAKHTSLNPHYQVVVLVEYVEYSHELEQITDVAIREQIYRDFAKSDKTIQEIDLDAYLDTKWKQK